jgi:hypothetical protein
VGVIYSFAVERTSTSSDIVNIDLDHKQMITKIDAHACGAYGVFVFNTCYYFFHPRGYCKCYSYNMVTGTGAHKVKTLYRKIRPGMQRARGRGIMSHEIGYRWRGLIRIGASRRNAGVSGLAIKLRRQYIYTKAWLAVLESVTKQARLPLFIVLERKEKEKKNKVQ